MNLIESDNADNGKVCSPETQTASLPILPHDQQVLHKDKQERLIDHEYAKKLVMVVEHDHFIVIQRDQYITFEY